MSRTSCFAEAMSVVPKIPSFDLHTSRPVAASRVTSSPSGCSGAFFGAVSRSPSASGRSIRETRPAAIAIAVWRGDALGPEPHLRGSGPGVHRKRPQRLGVRLGPAPLLEAPLDDVLGIHDRAVQGPVLNGDVA